jgi:hypothetical protein
MSGMGKLGVKQRRWLLTFHVLFAAIMFGVAIVFLILSLTAANTTDEGVLKACYIGMHVLAGSTVQGSTIATLVTGILLSVLTQWGLFKFYWMIAKEGLTLVSILLGPVGMYYWTLKAVTLTNAEGLGALQDPAFHVNSNQLWIGIFLQILSIAAMFVLSVFKPWGQRAQKKRPTHV